MGKYYFTYEGDFYNREMGKEPRRQPFKGGWTEVEAPDLLSAVGLFFDVHPETRNYAEELGYDSEYDEEKFRELGLAEKGINGYKCVERITMNVEVLDRGAINA